MPLPDEGLIHAWLDGQLPAVEAERVEHLVATDPAWEAAAAEARGLVAASSRILAALDDVPSGVLPIGGTVSRKARRLPWWTKAAAAIVIIVGGSTLVLQRAQVPTVADVTQTTAPIASKPVTAPVAAPVTPPVQLERRDVAKAAPKAAPKAEPTATSKAVVSAPVTVALAEQPKPQASATAKAEASAPAPAPSLQEARTVGGVLQSNVGGAPAQRVADQRMDAQRAREQQAGAQRDAAAPVMARVESPFAANKAANALTSVVVTGMTATPTVTVGTCYAMRDSKTSGATGIVMRGEKQVADTLFLAPLRPLSPMRGWIMAREGVLRGVLTTEAEGRGMLLVTAAPVACPAP